MHHERAPGLRDLLALGLLYFVGAKAGVALTVMPEGMAILWPPNGVLLAFLIRFGLSRFAGFAGLTLVAEVAADVPTFHVSEALLFGMNNIAEATLAFFLLRRWRFDARFVRLADLVKFVAAGPLLAAFVAGCVGALIYSTFRGSETAYLEFLRIFWLGDALGLLIVTPLLLGLTGEAAGFAAPERLRRSDGLVAAAGLAAFGVLLASRDGTWQGMQVGPVLLLPFVIFAAARFGLSAAAIAVAAVAVVIMLLATGGANPFGPMTPRATVVQAQEFILVMSLMALGLAALLSQVRASQRELELVNRELRKRALALQEANLGLRRAEAEVLEWNIRLEERVRDRTKELEDALAQVKRLQGMLPICAWCKKVRDDEDYWHSVEDYITRRTDVQFSHGICPECWARIQEDTRGPLP